MSAMIVLRCALFALVLSLASSPALAWGLRGHEIIGEAAVAHLPQTLPDWLRAQGARDEIVYLQSEEDRLKVGRPDEAAWYREWSTDHYIDIGDDGKIAGAVAIDAMPPTRDEYIAALYGTKPATDPYAIGFLPYAILEGYEQVRSGFALERFAEDALAATSADTKATADAKAAAQLEVERRRALVIHDIGVFGHFVGDGSQPLHVSVHYNGWGNYPNPNGYTTASNTHASYEDDFVVKYLTLPLVLPLVGPAQQFQTVPQVSIDAYLATTLHEVIPFYELQKRGAFDLADSTSAAHADGVKFTAARLAAAAQMLDSLIVTAYQTSTAIKPYTGQ
ncbi:MAG: S1/P1 Nuclease [Candidatus Eremiobacteraeota bacterium]|nr:S1/P1 Nuclease [Candidatus Eremiobacteraeota bacterium]